MKICSVMENWNKKLQGKGWNRAFLQPKDIPVIKPLTILL